MNRAVVILLLVLTYELPSSSGSWLDFIYATGVFFKEDVEAAEKALGDAENELKSVGDWVRKESSLAYNSLGKDFRDFKGKLNNAKQWIEKEDITVEKKFNQVVKWLEKEGKVVEDDLRNDTQWLEKKVVHIIDELEATSGRCLCYNYTCGCCVHMDVEEIELNSTVCLNLTYLKEDYGLSLTLTLNNHTLYNETISARNPPPICVRTPLIPELADICVRMYDVNVTYSYFHACVRIEARMKKVLVAKYDLGCFHIGGAHSRVEGFNSDPWDTEELSTKDNDDTNAHMNYPSVLLV